MSEYVLELSGISKSFPGVKALNEVKFSLKPGEIHALMGENGSGKSTFIKVITGVHLADCGEMKLDGKRVKITNPKEAASQGIAAIYQHVTSFPHLSVAENIFMGHEKIKNGIIQWKQMNAQATELLDNLNAEFKATDIMGSLSVAQQQMVEIAKALSMNARIIIMDEPTAALTKNESEELYRISEKLRDDGKSIIFISHRLEDIYRLASRVTIFRDSNYIGCYDIDKISPEEMIKHMVGREIKELFPKPEVEIGDEVLRVEDLSRVGFYKNVNFNVKAGEIVGITGLVGAGRTEVMQTIFGVEKLSSGKILFNGKEITIKSPGEAIKNGIGLLPEDRQLQGLILDWGIGRNISLPEIKRYVKKLFVDIKDELEQTKELAQDVDVKAVTIYDKASSLSGGNQQKVVVAKALNTDLKVLIMDEPTKGVDVGAKASIYKIMGDLAKQGLAIIVVSSEMPEILGMCDRIFVMCEGRVTGELSREEADQEKILELAMKRHKSKKTIKQ